MRAFVIAVGSELLGEDRLDTNSLRLTACLARHGVAMAGKSVVGDSQNDLVGHLEHAMAVAEVVILSGGLGPTTDDLTRQAVSRALQREMTEAAWIVEDIRAKFRGFGVDMPEVNRRQAMVIEGAEVLMNQRGTAPGLRLEHRGRQLFLLPGVPHELDHMIEVHLDPWLGSAGPGTTLGSKSLRVACRSESAIEEALTGVYERFGADEITVLASPGDVEVRITVAGEARAAAARLAEMVAAARQALGPAVYAERREADLESVVGALLAAAHQTVVTAESCTGGLIAERLTRVPGSSAYFRGGVVTYANDLKLQLAGVSSTALETHGAVSEEVARQMALGVRDRLRGDYGLSATGVAGPDGGTPDKPVGTVHVALAGPDRVGGTFLDHRLLSIAGGQRDRVRRLTSQWALELLRRRLLGQPHSG